MFLAIPFAVGLLVGKLSGGAFHSLARAPLRGALLFLLGFAIQLVLYTGLTDHQTWNIRYGHVLYVVSLLLLLAGLSVNIGRLRWPVLILTAGAALNFIVIAANGGAMPVQASLLTRWGGPQLVSQIRHHRLASNVVPAGPQTRLALLEDRISIPGPIPQAPASLGDLLIGLGGLTVVIAEMHRRPRAQTAESGLKARGSLVSFSPQPMSLARSDPQKSSKGEGA